MCVLYMLLLKKSSIIFWSGVEESNLYKHFRRMLSYPLNERQKFGAPEESRTPKIPLLRRTRIPIPSPGQINIHMIPTSKKPTVEIFYKLYAHQKYVPYGYHCIDSEFIPSYVIEIKSFKDDELYIQQEKEFTLTTIGAPTKNRT